eukprot:TRINITY_DN47624_c0_g1_i1.p2 TRINITY_DN47624_c0_g1~~TRINITY_DN47624_c0_g1_i1.p2  ORF type:complete len:417 (+),score=48.48 TRINITY_DN47624_c0_g1_i1:1610-2860(+)
MLRSVHPLKLPSRGKKMRQDILSKVAQRVVERRMELLWFFRQADTEHTGLVDVDVWRDGLSSVLQLDIAWRDFQDDLIQVDDNRMVDYNAFCNRYKVNLGLAPTNAVESALSNADDSKGSFTADMLAMLYEGAMKADMSLEEVVGTFGKQSDKLTAAELARNIQATCETGLNISQLEELVIQVRTMKVEGGEKEVTGEEFVRRLVGMFCPAGAQVPEEQKEILTELGRLLHRFKGNSVRMFQHFDTNNDGFVSYEEFASAIQRLQQHVQQKEGDHRINEIAELVKLAGVIDVNNDGRINFMEFCRAFYRRNNDSAVQSLLQQLLGTLYEHRVELRRAFQFFDTDHDGTVTADELRAGLGALNTFLTRSGFPPLTDVQIATITAHVDRNADGAVDYEEFLDAFQVVDTGASSNSVVC